MPERRYSEVRGRQLTSVEAVSEKVAMSAVGYRYLVHLAPKIDKVLIPRTNGRWTSVGRGQVALVTTTGAKSGEKRPQPLLPIIDGDDLVLIGSNYGRSWHPAWVFNLLANPECEVTFEGSTATYVARELDGDERQKAWDRAVDVYRGYAVYEKRAHPRRIKVFRLTQR